FTNKFAKRHMHYTRKFIQEKLITKLFAPLQSLPQEELEVLVSNWVHLHEESHRRGLMPIPRYLFEKSSRYSACLEELRADISAMITCLDKTQEEDVYFKTYLFILSERLLGYPLFRDLKKDFDAYSSCIFLHELIMSGNGEISEGKLILAEDIKDTL